MKTSSFCLIARLCMCKTMSFSVPLEALVNVLIICNGCSVNPPQGMREVVKKKNILVPRPGQKHMLVYIHP